MTSFQRVRCREDKTLHALPAGYSIDWQDGTQGRVYRTGIGHLKAGRWVDRDYLYCHGKLMAPVAVKGKHNAAIRCTRRCQGAMGNDCECECGGANHGIG